MITLETQKRKANPGQHEHHLYAGIGEQIGWYKSVLTGFSGQNVVRTCKWIPRNFFSQSFIFWFTPSKLPAHQVWLINFIIYILIWDCVHKDYSVNIKKGKKIIVYLTSDCAYFSVLKWIFPHSIDTRTKLFDQLSLIAFNVIWIQWMFWRCQWLLCNTFCDLKKWIQQKMKQNSN